MASGKRSCCVAVCTSRRPAMLGACLDSLNRQHIPPGWNVLIVVVDNDAAPSASGIVSERSAACRFPISYMHEPKRGIPFARNMALETALGLGAEWIAFIDDDEVAEQDWLGSLMRIAGETSADVLHGQTRYSYPASCGKWVKPKKSASRKTGDSLVTCSTNNVMFRSRLIAADGLNLRFDENRALSGGSDTDFFYRVTDGGGTIIHVAEATVTENVPEERCTFKWRIKRSYRCSASASSIEIGRKGHLKSAPRLVTRFVLLVAESLALLLPLPLLLPVNRQLFSRTLFKSARRFASALGIIAAYFGRLPEPYATIEGH